MVGFLEAVIPSIAVGLLFYFVMRKIVRADRNERNAMAALDEQAARRAAEMQSAERGARDDASPSGE
ncbi:hypothetical protein [Luteimicrobium subarcticum]|uniref:Uncharacterized protein n=1 Tax=Luteimicrobium subarcticum TaxID=620910 RepID=A0A2M8WSP7_9MICO|nr:hypothetical protein [Luteimicrobium subarcticum]PJI93953.1 hypothetical protein CLV34_1434 [Luteimicrobium subarcticum]